jgi:hypothetical protein
MVMSPTRASFDPPRECWRPREPDPFPGRSRPAIAIIGDGSFQYSVQPIWTAAALEDTPSFPP